MSKEKITGQFNNYRGVETKAAGGGTFYDEVYTPGKPDTVKTSAVIAVSQRTRKENLQILEKLVAKGNELFKGENVKLVDSKDLEKLPDAQLDALVKDFLKKANAFI